MTGLKSLYFDDVFPYLLVFSRIFGAFITMPAFGASFINYKIRLLLALSIAAVILPAVFDVMPKAPTEPFYFFTIIAGEIFIGIFMGTIAKFIFAAIEIAGTIIGFQSGLMNATAFNPAESQQSSLQGAFLGLVAIMIIFATDTHHIMLQSVIESYKAFTPGGIDNFNMLSHDMFETLATVASISITLAVQLAAPFMILSLLFFIGLGVLNRLMPQMAVFFVAQPFQIFMAFVILLLVLSSTIGAFMDRFQEIIGANWQTIVAGK